MAHITEQQRYTIQEMLKAGYRKTEIAKVIGKHKSVVGREIKRNCDGRSGEYRCGLAQRKCQKRQREKPKRVKFTQSVREEAERLLREDCSPEQVVGTLRKLGRDTVSTERLYQHVWQDKRDGGTLHGHLRHRGRRYRKRGRRKDSRGIIKNRVDIDRRPEIVDRRERFGDMEVDLIIGKNHKQAIVTMNDRASGAFKMKKVSAKGAQEVADAIVEELKQWKPYLHTITSDNGKEFAMHELVAQQLEIDYYFAKPYHSWERGSNENLNGLIRQYFEKSADFSQITEQRIKEIETKINNRPRKRFGFENPIFVMNQLLFNLEVAFVT